MQGITLQEVDGDLVINVPDESTVIGRGQFLQVTDKRVSRSHAMLEVCDGKLYITPTHTNPCFLRTQSSKDQKPLTRDMKQLLDHGDEFGLLPDQFFYRVSYPHLNGNERTDVKKEDIKSKEEGDSGEAVSNGVLKETKGKDKSYKKNTNEDLDLSRETNNTDNKKIEEASESEDETKEKTASGKDTEEDHGDMTLPLKKKRALPDWMVKVVESPTTVKPAAKKLKTATGSRRQPGTKVTKPNSENDDDNSVDEEEEDHTQKGSKKGAPKDSDDDFEEEPSDDDYVPEKTTSRKRGGKSQKKKKTSDSEEDVSDEDDDDYSPKKGKSKASKKTPKGKGGAKGKKTSSRPARSTPQRSRAKKRNSDDEEEEAEEALPRRRHRKEDEEEESPLRRPQRAARQKRGSYVDDPMIEEALEDFASDNENDVNEDKDSDFMVEGEEESGSDWEKSANSSQKQKASKSKTKGPPRGPTKRVAGKKKARRPSKARDNSDGDEDAMEDDEPYVPRPSKRRGGAVSHDSDESDEGGQKKKRRREPCQYGKKCYRKNPVHFRTYCHPGDSSYDEEDKDSSSPKEVSRKEKESRTSSEKPSRPQRSTAGTRLVTHGAVDGLPDDNDDGTQHTDESGADDSDYNIDEDVPVPARDSKKSPKNKKQPAKAVGSD